MNFDEKKEEWIGILNKIFPIGIPKHCEWIKLEDIISILNTIGSIKNSNHMFYPSGGGLDVLSSKLSTESNCIEIFTGRTDILKPMRMTFESFEDPIWNYFRIENFDLDPTGIYKEKIDDFEELVEIEPRKYINRSHWDIDEYKGQKLPKSSRIIIRHLKGSFVIFAKSSFYNMNTSTYDARHNKMSSNEFREHIENAIKKER